MYSVLSLSERLSVHMGSCLFLLVWGLRFWASGCLSCVFHALDHWSENRHLGVSTALVGTGHDAKKAEKVKAGFEEITGDERRTLSWSGNMAKEKEGPAGGQAQVWRRRRMHQESGPCCGSVALAPSSIFIDLTWFQLCAPQPSHKCSSPWTRRPKGSL